MHRLMPLSDVVGGNFRKALPSAKGWNGVLRACSMLQNDAPKDGGNGFSVIIINNRKLPCGLSFADLVMYQLLIRP
jgi:hypothetical protein